MKKIISLLLVFCMVLGMSVSVFAENGIIDEGTWGGIDWTLSDDGTLTIAPTTGEPTQIANKKTDFKVGEWPEAVRYNTAGEGAAIEGWPYDRTAVKKLVIEEGVTSIGSFTAQGFTNLIGEVVIPSTVTYIGQEAFQFSTMTKLTFAEGGTEALTIAQGALKNLIIEEIEFPADRPAVYLKAWVLNNCDQLKHVTFPANVASIGGTNQVDYFYFSASNNSGNHSQLTYYCDNLDAITFGSEEVKDLYLTTWGNPITTVGVKDNHKVAQTVATVGLTYCTSLEAAAKYAEPGDTITLLKDSDEDIELYEGVTLDENGVAYSGTITYIPYPTTEEAPPSTPDTTVEEDDSWYEEEEDTHTSKSDMQELIDGVGKKARSITIDLLGDDDTIGYSALKLAAEEGLSVELDGSHDGYFWTFNVTEEALEGFKGSFNAYVDVDAGATTSLKKVLKNVDNYQIFKTEHEGKLPVTTTLSVKLDKALRSADELHLYYWNADKKQVEEVNVEMSKDGNYLCMALTHCSTYIITDAPISGAVEAGVTVTTPVVSVDKANPETGAYDFVGMATALAVVSVLGGAALSLKK